MNKQIVLSVLSVLTFAACSPVQQTAAPTSAQGSSILSGAGDAAPAMCSSDEQASRFATYLNTELDWYRARTTFLPNDKSRPIFYQGTNGHAVVIVHGYNSSPNNERDMIIDLAKRGFTVLAVLLNGYGSDSATANNANMDDWRKAVEDAVKVVAPCNSKVSLLGHSFGGTLVTDEVLSGRIGGISHIVALAPFYKSSAVALDYAVDYIAPRYPIVDIGHLTSLSGVSAYDFFPVPSADASEPEPSLPMLAMQKVFQSQSLFSVNGSVSSVPIFLTVSRGDLVIDNNLAINLVNSRFSNSVSLVYPAADKIGHSFQRRPNNPKFDELMTRMAAFLNR